MGFGRSLAIAFCSNTNPGRRPGSTAKTAVALMYWYRVKSISDHIRVFFSKGYTDRRVACYCILFVTRQCRRQSTRKLWLLGRTPVTLRHANEWGRVPPWPGAFGTYGTSNSVISSFLFVFALGACRGGARFVYTKRAGMASFKRDLTHGKLRLKTDPGIGNVTPSVRGFNGVSY
ncbi:hypothetical protein LY76DRAFT_54389 [Colletotrichum caudatum]|nr:hypothetical protein LY76DRAFT_54389 [Colletotrichum caudatum]